MSSTIIGGWNPYESEISSEAMDVFNAAMEGHIGVDYQPVAVATQLVSGMNYSFFCNAKGVYPNSRFEASLVSIYAPLDGDPQITEIRIMPIYNY